MSLMVSAPRGCCRRSGTRHCALSPPHPAQVLFPAPLHTENVEPFRGNTVRTAATLQQNGVLGSLLAVVASVRRCHSGEAFVRLKVGADAGWGTWQCCGAFFV